MALLQWDLGPQNKNNKKSLPNIWFAALYLFAWRIFFFLMILHFNLGIAQCLWLERRDWRHWAKHPVRHGDRNTGGQALRLHREPVFHHERGRPEWGQEQHWHGLAPEDCQGLQVSLFLLPIFAVILFPSPCCEILSKKGKKILSKNVEPISGNNVIFGKVNHNLQNIGLVGLKEALGWEAAASATASTWLLKS